MEVSLLIREHPVEVSSTRQCPGCLGCKDVNFFPESSPGKQHPNQSRAGAGRGGSSPTSRLGSPGSEWSRSFVAGVTRKVPGRPFCRPRAAWWAKKPLFPARLVPSVLAVLSTSLGLEEACPEGRRSAEGPLLVLLRRTAGPAAPKSHSLA